MGSDFRSDRLSGGGGGGLALLGAPWPCNCHRRVPDEGSDREIYLVGVVPEYFNETIVEDRFGIFVGGFRFLRCRVGHKGRIERTIVGDLNDRVRTVVDSRGRRSSTYLNIGNGTEFTEMFVQFRDGVEFRGNFTDFECCRCASRTVRFLP